MKDKVSAIFFKYCIFLFNSKTIARFLKITKVFSCRACLARLVAIAVTWRDMGLSRPPTATGAELTGVGPPVAPAHRDDALSRWPAATAPDPASPARRSSPTLLSHSSFLLLPPSSSLSVSLYQLKTTIFCLDFCSFCSQISTTY